MHKLFASQLDDEKIYVVVRRHWFYLAKRLFVVFLFLISYVLMASQGERAVPGLFTEPVLAYTTVFLRLYLIGVLFAFLIVWVLYYLHMQIITNIRLVDVNQISLFARTVSELNIHNVQDVTSEAHGLFSTFFGFGDVFVQTAGVQQRFVFEMVAHPEDIKKLLLDLYEDAAHKNPAENPTPVNTPPAAHPSHLPYH